MANRPCKPDADVKRIWQRLLPDTPFPACGMQEDAAKGGDAAPANAAREYAEARPGFPRPRRSRPIFERKSKSTLTPSRCP